MAFFAIVLFRPNDVAWKKITTEWGDRSFIVNNRFAIISSEDMQLTADIAKRAGIGKDSDSSGLVIQMDYYSGTGSNSLVEWMEKNS